jgi:hypothetical protein
MTASNKNKPRKYVLNIGDIFKTNYWGDVEVICNKNTKSILVRFLNTGNERTCRATDLRGGGVEDVDAKKAGLQRQDYVSPQRRAAFMRSGERYSSNLWGVVEVLEYKSSKEVLIMFIESGNVYTVQRDAILKGLVADVEESKRITAAAQKARRDAWQAKMDAYKDRQEELRGIKSKEKASKQLGRDVWRYTINLLRTCRKEAAAKASKLRIKIKSAEWYEKNRKHVIARASQYQKHNVERTRVRNRNRRSRRMGAKGSHTVHEVMLLLESQNNKCNCCSVELTESTRELDHIMPLALGGTNYISNLQWLCQFCNGSKNSTHPDEWAVYSTSYEFKKRRQERLSTAAAS